MKLRFVKFLTSRENEIEEKEKEDCHCVFYRHPARPRPEPMRYLLLPSSFPSSLPPPSPTSPLLHHSSFSSATGRESNTLQLSLPSCSASPFLLHKITETAERGEKNRAGASLPTQLSYPTITRQAPSSPPPLLLHPIGWPSSTPVPMATHLWRLEP